MAGGPFPFHHALPAHVRPPHPAHVLVIRRLDPQAGAAQQSLPPFRGLRSNALSRAVSHALLLQTETETASERGSVNERVNVNVAVAVSVTGVQQQVTALCRHVGLQVRWCWRVCGSGSGLQPSSECEQRHRHANRHPGCARHGENLNRFRGGKKGRGEKTCHR